MRLTPFVTAAAAALMFSASAHASWDLWDKMKAVGMEDARVVDYSDSRAITTSEGQSYALFFALVAGDRDTFEKMVKWTQDNLAGGRLDKTLPAWLWGATGGDGAARRWGIIDTNNAVDSDMWIAYCLLEAGRLWNRPDYTDKGKQMMALIAKEIRDVKNVGKVLLPGRVGFETKDTVKLNPSYYPLFILRRFAEIDPMWNTVFDGSLRVLLRSAPKGFAPDWVRFDKEGRIVEMQDPDNAIGSYNAIRTYLWAGMMSPKDPAYAVLKRQFQPMVEAAVTLGAPPEKVNLNTLAMNKAGNPGFAACILELAERTPSAQKTAARIRTMLTAMPVQKDNYYTNMLVLFGLGFDYRLFAFDENGRVWFPRAAK